VNLSLAIIALVTVGAAVVAMSGRNLLHSVLLLTVSWAGVAAFYLWAGAEFVAFAQLLVYVGAISMAVLFAVLLTRRSRDDLAAPPASRSRGIYAILAGVAVAAVLLGAVSLAPLSSAPTPPPSVTVRQLGDQLMGPHAASLLVIAALLTVALIGAVVLAAGGSPGNPEDKS
jgi:NADH:ubiquinone oxidoreductase subunit 6 (subunit J)